MAANGSFLAVGGVQRSIRQAQANRRVPEQHWHVGKTPIRGSSRRKSLGSGHPRGFLLAFHAHTLQVSRQLAHVWMGGSDQWKNEVAEDWLSATRTTASAWLGRDYRRESCQFPRSCRHV